MDITKKQSITNTVIENVIKCYDREQTNLANLARHASTEGEIREAAGNLVEHILQNIFDSINSACPEAQIVSKVGSTDYLSKTIEYRGKTVTNDHIQVDRHVYSRGKRICFIENKTYLDSCYYDRALADFRKIAQSLFGHGKDPADCKYIVFAGQNAASTSTMFTYEADFWNDTRHLTDNSSGLETKTFFFLRGKRSSQAPLYAVKHELDLNSIRNFVYYILDMLN